MCDFSRADYGVVISECTSWVCICVCDGSEEEEEGGGHVGKQAALTSRGHTHQVTGFHD